MDVGTFKLPKYHSLFNLIILQSLITLHERLNPLKWLTRGSFSPVVVRKLGPPLLAGEPASCGEDFPSVIFSFTHNALSDIDYIIKNKQIKQLIQYWSVTLISVTSHDESYLSSHRGHSWRSSSPLRCSRRPPRADVYRRQPDASRSWTLWCWGII